MHRSYQDTLSNLPSPLSTLTPLPINTNPLSMNYPHPTPPHPTPPTSPVLDDHFGKDLRGARSRRNQPGVPPLVYHLPLGSVPRSSAAERCEDDQRTTQR